MVEENKNKKPMDIVAEQKLEKWLSVVGMDKEGDKEGDKHESQAD